MVCALPQDILDLKNNELLLLHADDLGQVLVP